MRSRVVTTRTVKGVAGQPSSGARAWVMLVLATAGFAVNFWAWALLSPLGPKFKDVLGLSSSRVRRGTCQCAVAW
jgi:MFS transporter, NNP family, nitrate/nitrite transporter